MAAKKEMDILGRAMLANVTIGVWEARKHDRAVTDKVHDEYHAGHEAGRYHKHLFGGPVPELSAVVTAAHYLRWTHYAQTLPWSDAGPRLLPTANYWQYREIMNEKYEAFIAAAETLCEAYPRLVKDAKVVLNGMWREEDYPTVSVVRSKYHASFDYQAIASSDDFRVTLPKEEMKRITKAAEERIAKAVENAMMDAWSRMLQATETLKEKLANDGKGLRGAVLGDAVKIDQTTLTELVDVLGRLNLTNDPALEKARKQVQAQLVGLDVKDLKKDETARQKAQLAVDSIYKQIQSVYTPPAEE